MNSKNSCVYILVILQNVQTIHVNGRKFGKTLLNSTSQVQTKLCIPLITTNRPILPWKNTKLGHYGMKRL